MIEKIIISNRCIMRIGEMLPMMNVYEFSNDDTTYPISAKVIVSGPDVVVVVGGGTDPHVGAVAAAHSQPSINDPGHLTSTASVITIPGHKEDMIARQAALRLSRAIDKSVVVSVGIHIDDASTEDIQKLVEQFDVVVEMIEDHLRDLFFAQPM